jgi:hypothetical protein
MRAPLTSVYSQPFSPDFSPDSAFGFRRDLSSPIEAVLKV